MIPSGVGVTFTKHKFMLSECVLSKDQLRAILGDDGSMWSLASQM